MSELGTYAATGFHPTLPKGKASGRIVLGSAAHLSATYCRSRGHQCIRPARRPDRTLLRAAARSRIRRRTKRGPGPRNRPHQLPAQSAPARRRRNLHGRGRRHDRHERQYRHRDHDPQNESGRLVKSGQAHAGRRVVFSQSLHRRRQRRRGLALHHPVRRHDPARPGRR